MEAALAVAALVVVLVLCTAGLAAISAQIRCVDAAREAARLAARGDERAWSGALGSLAPANAVLQVRRVGDFVVARVSSSTPLLPGLTLGAESIAAVEPAG